MNSTPLLKWLKEDCGFHPVARYLFLFSSWILTQGSQPPWQELSSREALWGEGRGPEAQSRARPEVCAQRTAREPMSPGPCSAWRWGQPLSSAFCERPREGTTQLCNSWISDPPNMCEIIKYCRMLPSLGKINTCTMNTKLGNIAVSGEVLPLHVLLQLLEH